MPARKEAESLFQHRVSGCLFAKPRVMHPCNLSLCGAGSSRLDTWECFFFLSEDDKNRIATHFQLRHKKNYCEIQSRH